MKKWAGLVTNLTMLTQFGVSLVTPLFLCIFICWWICNRWQVGEWIYLLGFFFGMGGSGMTAWKFYRSVMKQQENTQKEKKKTGKTDRTSFNRHI